MALKPRRRQLCEDGRACEGVQRKGGRCQRRKCYIAIVANVRSYQGVSPSRVQIQSRLEIHRNASGADLNDRISRMCLHVEAVSLKVGASAQLSSDCRAGVRKRTAKEGFAVVATSTKGAAEGCRNRREEEGLLLDECMGSFHQWSSQTKMAGTTVYVDSKLRSSTEWVSSCASSAAR